MRTNLFRHLLFLGFTTVLGTATSAQTLSSRLVDAKTKEAIPYATVQYEENKGIISNEEGRFSLILDELRTKPDSLVISSMGYERTALPTDQVLDSVIFIAPKAIELSGVYLFDKELEAEEIIEKMIERLPQNVNKDPIKQRYFLRQSIFGNIQKVDFGFEKSSIEELNEALIDSIAMAIPRSSSHYSETLGDFYKTKEEYKVNVLKAAELYDKKNIGSFEDLGKRMETMFKQNVKPDSYLKIKSGIFSQKVQVDSILSDMEEEEAKKLAEEMETDTVSGVADSQKHIFDELLGELYYKEDTKLNLIDKYRKYEYRIAGYSEIDEEGVYVIEFIPKRSADFKGRLYINIEDFAVMQIDFENLRNLKNFRLLGIFYRETLYKGTMRFGKLSNGRYDLKFADLSFGRWFRFDRPLDVIEKNKHVKGRRKQNELKLNIDFRMANTNKWELVVFENELINQSGFDNYTEDKSVRATYMAQYNPEFWEGYNIMEPNKAIREFRVSAE
ncbi:carboxypeptidase-like regulatory domain-containing protein [Poritiphilus flavus]|uniref:Carboxypeptidase-like regulatory domain-containing protein n=1 Tax=Poritiphilus flavus TaxID=2697053 RepID=A0A6L9EHU1_9FLAO|nr:carboxypeptidase-like regulatory domain-containing protein [Poritiphilus flavus]NAS14243.1 carboxypeptidase-like regulatory domain-containing protein [Poritiphilus flavus]